MPFPEYSLELFPADTLKERDTIQDALRLLGDRYGDIAVVLDDGGRFSGVVSPGDLRKAILKGFSPSSSLGGAANRSPVVVHGGEFKGKASASAVYNDLCKRYTGSSVMSAMIPVIDGEKRLLGMVSLASLFKPFPDLAFSQSHRSVLIIGGAGYIGSVLVRLLLADGWMVRVLDMLLYSDVSLKDLDGDKRFMLIRGDAKNIDTLVNAAEGVDAVVYLAELVGDPACDIAPQTALKTNYLAVTTLAQLCAHVHIGRFVYTSSCSVYGASRDAATLLTEDSPAAPVSLYGKIKVMVENALLEIAAKSEGAFSPTILRLGTVFGKSFRPRFDLVVNRFVRDAMLGGHIVVHGGGQWRPFVYVSDAAAAIVKALDAPREKAGAQIFNVSGANHTIGAVADFAAEVFPGVAVTRNEAPDDPRNYRADCGKIRSALGFETTMSVGDGMREIRDAVERGEIFDLNSSRYSNHETLKVLNLG